ncbi:MAG TPA: flagellar hook-length control protein FliK [Candidatus Anaerobiospirillum stercoravium]|nr:flagellar hook-length control protein FliK [Candidatus Anaerobiospirillum stercoravium]
MQTLPDVYSNQAVAERKNAAGAKGSSASSGSTANRFDFLMGVADDSIEHKFSSMLTSIKTQLGNFDSGGAQGQDRFAQAVDEIQTKADELKDEQEEEERKKKEGLAAERRAQDHLDDLAADQLKNHERQAAQLQAQSQELQAMHSMQVSAERAGGDGAAAAGASGAVRPSDLLASAMARRSADSGSMARTGAISAAAAASASTSTSTGQGSTDLGANAQVGLEQGGYGTDANTNSARAARAMLQVDGVSSELNAGELETLNQSTERKGGSVNQSTERKDGSVPASSSSASSLAEAEGSADVDLDSSNTQELKQRLDVLARETHVSKLSLQMANPATLAAERRNAQTLANLPTSNNQVAALTAATTTQQKVISGVITQSGPSSSSEALTQGARSALALNHGAASVEDTQRVASATNVKVSEAKSSSAQELTRLAHSTQQSTQSAHATSAGTAATAGKANVAGINVSGAGVSNAEIAAAKQAVVDSHGASALPNRTPGQSQVVPELSQPQGADDVKAQVQRTAARDLSHGVDLAQAAKNSEHGASTAAQAALLRLAGAQRSAGVTEPNPNLETLVLEVKGNNLDLNAANSVMLEAVKSLKQGSAASAQNSNAALAAVATATSAAAANAFGLGKAAAQQSGRLNPLTEGLYETYETSELYAEMFGEDGADAVATLTGANVGKSDETQDEAGEAEGSEVNLAQAQQATAQSAATESAPQLPPELTRFALSGNAEEDAQALHERVMQMAARNLKQLSVELSPNSLGKMRISIALSDDNNAIAVSLQAANPHTRELLAQALPQLRDTLAKQNVATDVNVYDYTRDSAQTAVAVANATSAAAKAKSAQVAAAGASATSAMTKQASAAAHGSAGAAAGSATAAAGSATAAARAPATQAQPAHEAEFVHPATRYVLPDITVAQLSENAMRQRDKLKVATIEDEIAALEAKRAARSGASTEELLSSVSAKELEDIARATLRDAGLDPDRASDLLSQMAPSAAADTADAAADAVPDGSLSAKDFGVERTTLTPMPEIRVDLNGRTQSARAQMMAHSAEPQAPHAPHQSAASLLTQGETTTTTAAALVHSRAQAQAQGPAHSATSANRAPRRLRNQARIQPQTLATSGIKRAAVNHHPVPGMTLRARAADAAALAASTSTVPVAQGKAALAQMSRLEALTSQLEAAAAKA